MHCKKMFQWSQCLKIISNNFLPPHDEQARTVSCGEMLILTMAEQPTKLAVYVAEVAKISQKLGETEMEMTAFGAYYFEARKL